MIPFEPLRWAPAPRQAASLTNVSCLPAVQTFSLHIGADLKLPTPNAQRHSSYEAAPAAVSATQAASDPFEGLPFRALAERMGAAMSPVVQAVSTCSTSLARLEYVHCAIVRHFLLTSTRHCRRCRAWCAATAACRACLAVYQCYHGNSSTGHFSSVCCFPLFVNYRTVALAGQRGRADEAAAGGGAAGGPDTGGGGALHPPLPALHPLVRLPSDVALEHCPPRVTLQQPEAGLPAPCPVLHLLVWGSRVQSSFAG